jgi:hypothetical protein
MKDTRRHYPKDPIIWGILPNVWATGGTICGKRRAIDWITDSPNLLTCSDCVNNALAYWTEQVTTVTHLIEYAESGKLKGTSAETESESLLPKIRIALENARNTVEALTERKPL